MQIIFIHHSCFLVEIDDKVLIFDYFNGDRVDGFHFGGKLPTYEKDTPIYMFASHSHADHYDMDILRMADQYPNIRYIFSKDIRISPNFLQKHGIDPSVRERVTFVKPDQTYQVDDLKIKTLGSTDSGVAFYVDVNGVTLFHAGDLNDWRMEHVGELINGRMKRSYRHEIKKLKNKPINVAFVPCDPRLGEYQFEGLTYFLETTDAEYVFPMHMWQKYSEVNSFKKKMSNRLMADRLMVISQENQTFLFEES
ncbi:MBL fold metallo-hydrolase [Agathobacter ruminis]|uniref:Metal-dependent hydrolase n=1 Tax=Agathobacter ruminis TaxID=1712665 RepID=A0A2G3E650_9FIRM|nr:MBL fold metallo-hydrolase [Agathobacter ruminis]MDC7300804.1 MBL fold metallo-hydrolase [Agathobacter ruminis]PHU38625.1 metal-dependent hydrolase [Agathobacter ruminis]